MERFGARGLIDLNPVRAGIVTRPEDYRWHSLGYHLQQNNKDGVLSLDFGLIEFGVRDEKERLRLLPPPLWRAEMSLADVKA